jgi:ribosomal protein RSM22 (predicted rRNA methylase)
MDLPASLRGAIDEALSGISVKDLARAGKRLTARYRGEVNDGTSHLSDDMAARAYLAARMPATYAAVRAAMARAAGRLPQFAPRTLLDIGAGPGTAMWAAKHCWPDINDAILIEGSAAIHKWGERFSSLTGIATIAWRASDITTDLAIDRPRDLVTLAYVLSELPDSTRAALIDRLWSLTASLLLIVEPGTPAGWQRILEARSRLIALGAHIAAPCPHHLRCPLSAPDWCHFAERLPRARIHRLVKQADVPWEDEKYIYLAAARGPVDQSYARIIAPPRSNKAQIELKLCCSDGTSAFLAIPRRDATAYKAARRLDWGDVQ